MLATQPVRVETTKHPFQARTVKSIGPRDSLDTVGAESVVEESKQRHYEAEENELSDDETIGDIDISELQERISDMRRKSDLEYRRRSTNEQSLGQKYSVRQAHSYSMEAFEFNSDYLDFSEYLGLELPRLPLPPGHSKPPLNPTPNPPHTPNPVVIDKLDTSSIDYPVTAVT